MKSRLKKKGIDIDTYIYDRRNERIRKFVPFVDSSLISRAIQGSAKHQELFYKRTGDLVNRVEIDHNVGLRYVFVPMQTPLDITQMRNEEKGTKKVIETTTTKIK